MIFLAVSNLNTFSSEIKCLSGRLLSCRSNILYDFADMEVTAIKKRASGQAFEVILKPPSPVSDAVHNFPSPPKRDISLEDIEKKLEAAEDRRKVGDVPSVRLWFVQREMK